MKQDKQPLGHRRAAEEERIRKSSARFVRTLRKHPRTPNSNHGQLPPVIFFAIALHVKLPILYIH